MIELESLMVMKDAIEHGDFERVISIASFYGHGHVNIVKTLLQDKRFNPAMDDSKCLRIASTKGQLEIVKLLLQDGRADPAIRNNRPIENASYNGHIKVVELLLQDRRVDPTADDSKALKWACYHGYLDIVELLLQDGRVEPTEWMIRHAMTDEIREMLAKYKYRVDGKEYRRLKENVK